MPNRVIRESSLTSETLDQLSAEAERLFFRLTVVVDDRGRFNADPRVILARCFPLRVDKLKPASVSHWLEELTAAGAVVLYCDGTPGKAYGYFPNWEKYQRVYGLKSKFPAPPAESRAFPQVPAVPRKTEKVEKKLDSPLFTEFWAVYPARNGKKLEKDESRKRFEKLSPEHQALCVQAARNYVASELVKKGIGIRDPKRFLTVWQDWVTPETPTANGKDVVCKWPTSEDGSYKMQDCGEPIAGPDVNPKQRPFCKKCLPLREALDKQIGRA